MLLLILVLMLRWMERGWDTGAGLMLALAALLRMQSLGRGPAWRVLDFRGWLMLGKEKCAFAALLLAYIAIYWFVTDCRSVLDERTQAESAAPILRGSRGSTRASTCTLQEICG